MPWYDSQQQNVGISKKCENFCLVKAKTCYFHDYRWVASNHLDMAAHKHKKPEQKIYSYDCQPNLANMCELEQIYFQWVPIPDHVGLLSSTPYNQASVLTITRNNPARAKLI